MSITTIAELRSVLGIGTLYPDATLQEVCDAADNVLLPFLWKNEESIIAHSSSGTTGTLYFNEDIREVFYIGQTVMISGAGSRYNGSKTITGVSEYSFTIAITAGNNNPYHTIAPYGVAAAETYTDYSTVASIQEASLMISVDIFQSRQAPSGGSITIDGYAPSPYRMGNTLLARVRALLAPYIDPRSMVG